MTKSITIFFLGIALSFNLQGQDSISGVVYDGENKRPMSKATVRMGNRNMRTDASGSFTIPFKKDEDLEVSAVGFHDYQRAPRDLTDLKNVSVYLTAEPSLSGLKVSAEAVGVYEPDFEYLFDYEFIDNLLIVGSYLNRNIGDKNNNLSIKNCALTLFERGEMIHRTLIPDFPQRFRRSAFNELFIQGLDYALIIDQKERKLSYREFDFNEYKSNVVPWTAAFPNSAFKVQIVREIPQVVHYCYRKETNSEEIIRIAGNRSYFSKTFLDYTMLDKSQKYRARELSKAQGFDEKLYAGYIRAVDSYGNFRRNQGVDRDIRPPYTPVYKRNGALLIFDAMNHWIYGHDQSGRAIDSVYFQIDLRGEELFRIEQDRVNEKIYAVHHKKGVYFIREIDPYTGALGNPMKLAYPFPKKIKIYNESVFYIRHDADAQFKHLYKESLHF